LAARRDGRLPSATRFQVSLPTPFAVIFPMCIADDEQLIEGAYESAIDVENTSGMLCLIPKVSFHRTLQKLLGCTPGRYFK
jgi:hypothetical protein